RNMLKRDEWDPLARELDWKLSYVAEEDAFPEVAAGRPFLPQPAWSDWSEPYRTTYTDYVQNQHVKDAAVYAVRDAIGRAADAAQRPATWLNALKLHAATLPLAEFAAVI